MSDLQTTTGLVLLLYCPSGQVSLSKHDCCGCSVVISLLPLMRYVWPTPLCFIWEKWFVAFLSGRLIKQNGTNGTYCRGLSLPQLPSMPAVCVTKKKKRQTICWTATHPENQIVIHRISPCFSPLTHLTHTHLTQMEKESLVWWD